MNTQKPKAQRMLKKDALEHWQGLPDTSIADKMRIIPYKQEGSKYGNCGIRIDGTTEFIDSVLSRLKDIIELENGNSRLELNYTQCTDRDTGLPMNNAWVCYIRAHERGQEAKMCNLFIKGCQEKNFTDYNQAAEDMIQTALNI